MTGQELAIEQAEQRWENFTLLQRIAEYDPENEKELIAELLKFWEGYEYLGGDRTNAMVQHAIRKWINDTYRDTFVQLAVEDAESDMVDRVYDEQEDR